MPRHVTAATIPDVHQSALKATLIALALVVSIPAVPAEAGKLFTGGCVNAAERHRFPVVGRSGPYLFRSLNGDTPAYRRVRAAVERFWPIFRRAMGPPSPRYDGANRPYEIFLANVRENDIVVGGQVAPYCGHPGSDAMGLFDYAGDERALVVHEGFHVFQYGAAGSSNVGGWWSEATASYVESVLTPDPQLRRFRDEIFVGAPYVPLDHFDQDFVNQRIKAEHPYGAWRFIQFVQRKRGWSQGRLLSFIRGTFAQIGRGTAHTPAVNAALGNKLGELLAEYWGTRLKPTGPPPATEGITTTVSPGTLEPQVPAEPLAASVGRLRVSADVTEISIEATDLGGGRLWVLADGQPVQWSQGDEQAFCVKPDGVTLESRWPDEVALAFTNPNLAGQAKLTLRIEASTEKCENLPIIDGNCPNPRQYRDIPGFSSRWAFRNLMSNVAGRYGHWYRLAYLDFGDLGDNPFALPPGYRRFGLVLECTASLLQPLRNAPGSLGERVSDVIPQVYDVAAQWNQQSEICRQAPVETQEGDLGHPQKSAFACPQPFRCVGCGTWLGLYSPVERLNAKLFDLIPNYNGLQREIRRCMRRPRRHRCRSQGLGAEALRRPY